VHFRQETPQKGACFKKARVYDGVDSSDRSRLIEADKMQGGEMQGTPSQRWRLLRDWLFAAIAGSLLIATPSLANVHGFEVKEYAHDFRVAPEQARSKLEIQDQGAKADIVGKLESGLGAQYAGVWFDNEAGEFVAPVLARGNRASIDSEFADVGLGADYRTIPVQFGWAELETAHEDLDEVLIGLIKDRLVRTALDPQTNAIVVEVAETASKSDRVQVDAAAARQTVAVEIKQSTSDRFHAELEGCSLDSMSCGYPLRGGVVIKNPNETVLCTAGFKAIGNTYGNRFMLTAGHCAKEWPNWVAFDMDDPGPEGWFTEKEIGPTAADDWPGGDWAVINANGSEWDGNPWPSEVAYWTVDHQRTINSESSSYMGEYVCKSGVASGSSCGYVTKLDQTVPYEAPGNPVVYHLTKYEGICRGGGDSGGPVFIGNTALGIHSGGEGELCGAGAIGFYSEITRVTDQLGVSVAPRVSAPPVSTTGDLSGFPQPHKATVGAKVDPNGAPTTYYFQYGTTTGYGSSTVAWNAGSGWQPEELSGTIEGLKGNTTYHYRLIASNSNGTGTGEDKTFTTPDWRPIVTPEDATEVKKSSAKLRAKINPQGSSTTYHFEYGLTTAYGTKVPIPDAAVGSGTSDVAVSQAISGLAIGTIYHFRAVAESVEGTTLGADREFKTPDKPLITTEEPSYVNTFEPQLNATIDPERAPTIYQFEYGTTTSYGTKIPVSPASIGSGDVGVGVEQTLKELQRDTVYHYRVRAANEVGISTGADQSFKTLPQCKGAEQKCVWSTQTAAESPPVIEDELKSISCASSTMCIAVGRNTYVKKSFVERWNGSSWSLLQSSTPGEIKKVSCASATACVAVGVSESGVAQSWLIYEYLGGWVISEKAPVIPGGATEVVFNSVSCTATTCTAAGSYKSESTYKTLIETWNGSTWSQQSTPNPSEGTAQKAMLAVSCIASPVACVTVGEAAGKPVAEGWAGAGWMALPAPPLPAGATGGRFNSVSCTSSACIAVGTSYEAAVGSEKTLIESWNGMFWTILSSPNPAEAKGFVNLNGISCVSSSACTAVGYYASQVSGTTPTEIKTLAESWNGSSWSIQSSPNLAEKKFSGFFDVSCTASSACTAVGTGAGSVLPGSQPLALGQPLNLAARWNGSTWLAQTTVNPTSPPEEELKSVSCASLTMCVAVGRNLATKGSIVERWNGTTWLPLQGTTGEIKKVFCALPTACVAVGVSASGVAQSWLIYEFLGGWLVSEKEPVIPAGATESALKGISCGPTACTAVGSYKSESTYKTLVETWNGTAWSLQSAPNPGEGTAQNAMLGASCASFRSATTCLAVGEAANKPVAERWNGSAWSLTSAPPLPSGATGAKFSAVSCGSPTSCMAVGHSYEAAAGSEKTLIETWDGSSWSILATPKPADAKGFLVLADVSCLSPNSCFAAGSYAPSMSGTMPLEFKTLAMTWAAGAWTLQSTPNASGKAYSALLGVSCTSSIACTGVGAGSSSLMVGSTALVERYE